MSHHRTKVKKNSAAPAPGELARLEDMDTREVSIVDRAANKRKFLVVKRDEEGQEGDVGATTAKKTETTTAAPAPETPAPAGEVKKMSGAASSISTAVERIRTLKLALETAPSQEGAATALPREIGLELRGLQFFLKGLTVAKGRGDRYYGGGYLGCYSDLTQMSLTPVAAEVKKGVAGVLGEAETRLSKLQGELEAVAIFDPSQTKAIDGVADLLGKVLVDHPVAPSERLSKRVVVISSLTGENRTRVLDAIQKAHGDLFDLHVALHQDDAVAKGHVADEFAVGSALSGTAAALETAIADLLAPKIVKFEDAKTPEAVYGFLDGLVGEVRSLQAKKDQKPEDVAKALGEIAARWGGSKNGEAPVATTQTQTEKKTEAPAAAQTTTAKVGRPMQTARLARLKSAVGILKEALADLRGGTAPMEKFKKAAADLSSILDELEVPTEKGVNGRAGVQNAEGGVDPNKPNVGAGVQPDTATVAGVAAVFGEGVPPGMGEVLKRLDTALEEIKKRDEKIDALAGDVAQLRKTRFAPSTVPDEDECSSAPESADEVDWPVDMSASRR